MGLVTYWKVNDELTGKKLYDNWLRTGGNAVFTTKPHTIHILCLLFNEKCYNGYAMSKELRKRPNFGVYHGGVSSRRVLTRAGRSTLSLSLSVCRI
jgi:hypothetical protein